MQLSRHPQRPYTLDYIKNMSSHFIELHGDRTVKDDKAMIGGWAKIDGKTLCSLVNKKERIQKCVNIATLVMPNPEGYRKALRLMKMAEKFGKPNRYFIDTPGAFPGLEAEERDKEKPLLVILIRMVQLKVPHYLHYNQRRGLWWSIRDRYRR